MTSQLRLDFSASQETPMHRERDRPKSCGPVEWSNWIDRICVRGGVKFTHESLLRDFYACCPQHRAAVLEIRDLTNVHMTHWEGYWDLWRPEGGWSGSP